MRHDVVDAKGVRWVDITAPSRMDLITLAVEFSLPATVVEDCLDPEHLPKYERFGDATFVILRARDLSAPDDASTIQELTRKVAMFYRANLLLTVHRADLSEIAEVRRRHAAAGQAEAVTLSRVLVDVVEATLASYEPSLDRAQAQLDAFEAGVFEDQLPAPTLRDAFHLKRRVALSQRILRQTNAVLGKVAADGELSATLFQDMRESAEAIQFWVDQLFDEVNQLLQLQLSMSSRKTNEVMRILTVFSAFFLPLTFIVGIYGMNFEHMPELMQPMGYPVTLLGMAGVALAIFIWFRRKGWL
jgi:magnesium transporter